MVLCPSVRPSGPCTSIHKTSFLRREASFRKSRTCLHADAGPPGPPSTSSESEDPQRPRIRKRKRRRRPRPRTNLGPPKTIQLDATRMPGGRPAARPRPQRLQEDSFFDVVRTVVGVLPGLRDITPTGFKPPPDAGPFPTGAYKGPPPPGASTYGEWASDIELGDDWAFRPGADYPAPPQDTRPRYSNTETPRDSYLKPIVDPIGIMDRLSFDRRGREERIAEEALLNSRETRAAVSFAGVWLFLLPFGLGYFVSRGLAEPVIAFVQDTNPERFQLSSTMKREGAHELKKEALRMRMEAQIGKAPPLTDEEVYHTLRHAAHEFEHEKQHEMRVGAVNLISDSITLVTFLVVLAKRNEGRRILTNTIGRVSQGMSQTGKAFILILVADVLMGYHSEEGWTAGIELLCEHYGVEALSASVAVFVSIVPVALDTAFKFWLFRGLNRIDPSASVTLKEIDRH